MENYFIKTNKARVFVNLWNEPKSHDINWRQPCSTCNNWI